jgi:hypothetical protein
VAGKLSILAGGLSTLSANPLIGTSRSAPSDVIGALEAPIHAVTHRQGRRRLSLKGGQRRLQTRFNSDLSQCAMRKAEKGASAVTRIATCILLSFVALAIVAVALLVNWAKASARTPGANRDHQAAFRAHPAVRV